MPKIPGCASGRDTTSHYFGPMRDFVIISACLLSAGRLPVTDFYEGEKDGDKAHDVNSNDVGKEADQEKKPLHARLMSAQVCH